MRRCIPPVLALLLVPVPLARAQVPGLEGGHLKGRWLTSTYPEDSIFRDQVGAVAHDQGGGLRLRFGARRERFGVNADYTLLGQFGDSLGRDAVTDDPLSTRRSVPDDDHRWWDLTHEIHDGNRHTVVQRLDRLHVDFRGERLVAKFGRQAVSWGNGLIYNPVDFFNPFSPAAVDTEYKLGDDMVYGQYVRDSGDDWQLVHVVRRDESEHVSADVASTALKYHGFDLEREYDLLLAEHFDQFVAAVGGVINIGESVVRGDVMAVDAEDGWEALLVANWSYSWTWGDYNVAGVAEYFFNGFGLRESQYSAAELVAANDLVDRLGRGELFTVGRHYLAGSMRVEVTPLLNLTPNLFLNLGDGSALLQLVLQWDVAQDWQVLGAFSAPLGPKGTEFGGIETGVEDLTLGVGPSLFAQVAWYF
jgi:hypothetical protein